MEHVLNMWIEVVTLEHIICPRIRKCLNQTGKSPYVEEHHLRTGEIRASDVTVALRRWARVAGRWLFLRDPLLIFRGIYMETVALDCPQISRYFTIDPQRTLDWQTQRLADSSEHVWRTEHVWNLRQNHPNQDWRSRRWTRDNGSVDDGARKRVHSGSESRQRHNYTSAGFPLITQQSLHNKNCGVIWEEYVNIHVFHV